MAIPSRGIRGLGERRDNLPTQPGPLIGRERDVEAARDRVLDADVRLLTLTGPGGTGKTRLALAVAAAVLEQFEHGACFVELAPIRDPALVGTAIARTLGLGGPAGQPLIERLERFLSWRELLLVLDNFEHLQAAARVAELLQACPRLKVLTTSRAALRLRWEHELPVPPLALPDLARLPDPAALGACPAVALFVARARAVKPGFALAEDNAEAVAALCARLDGLPLAIELAAARSKLLSPRAILARLGGEAGRAPLDLLTGGMGDLPARQQTLRQTITWSYALLDEREQALFRRLGAFVGGSSLEATEAVCAFGPLAPAAVLDGVQSLVDKSLLRGGLESEGEARLCMLETIHDFALEQLEAAAEADVVRRRLAEYAVALAERAEPELIGPGQAAWLEQLEGEHDNLRAVLGWSVERHEAQTAMRLGGALWRFWAVRGHLTEGRCWLAEALALPARSSQTVVRAKAALGAGRLAFVQGDLAAARARFVEGLEIARGLDERGLVGDLLAHLGHIARREGDLGGARARYEQSLTVERGLGDRSGIAIALKCLGHVARSEADHAAACALYEQSLAITRELDDRWEIADSLYHLGDLANERGEHVEARARFAEALPIWQELGDRWGVAGVLDGCAGLAAGQGRPELAMRLVGAGVALREAIGAGPSAAERAMLEHWAGSAFDAASAEAAYAEGRAMSPEQAIATARSMVDVGAAESPRERAATDVEMARLTPRQWEVAHLLARGLTNRQIAEALVVTEGTAALHVKNILRKLGFQSRGQVSAWVLRQKISTPSRAIYPIMDTPFGSGGG